MTGQRHWVITHAIGAPCQNVDPEDDVITDPEEAGDVSCYACLEIAPPKLIVEGEGHEATAKCPACRGNNILFREGGTEYGYVRGLSYDGGTLRIKLTDREGGDTRFWCADCQQTIDATDWDYDYA